MIFNQNDYKSSYQPNQINIIKWIFILMMAGIIFGTQVRTDIENLISLSAMGPFKYIHSFLGIGALMLTGVLLNKINNQEFDRINIKNKIKLLLNILIGQIGTGYFMAAVGLLSYVKLMHMWLASISLGIVIYILSDIYLSNQTRSTT